MTEDEKLKLIYDGIKGQDQGTMILRFRIKIPNLNKETCRIKIPRSKDNDPKVSLFEFNFWESNLVAILMGQ